MKFTLNPAPGEAGFVQWKDAMQALVRLPGGVPLEFRKSIWLNLSKKYIQDVGIDWSRTRRAAFNDRSNPDDDDLGIQIVKDLHRTGCSAFSGHENEQDRALLKRVLLAYARYNKSVGYCQGFNIMAALILEIVERREEDALMCMIYLVDHILPEGYFTNSMHTLAVDMTVFRELLKQKLPKLYIHLNQLQFNSMTNTKLTTKTKKKLPSQMNTYEPPLTNVFTMQWFLTLFATCLPKNVLLRVWDCIFLFGSEVLFRTSLSIWDKLSVSIMKATSADSFYSMMSILSVRLFDQNVMEENQLIDKMFSYGAFPLDGLSDLREKFTFNINPFQSLKKDNDQLVKLGDQQTQLDLRLRSGDQDEQEIDDLAKMISCFALLMPGRAVTSPHHKDIMIEAVAAANTFGSKKKDELSLVTPGAISFISQMYNPKPLSEQLTMDLNELKKQYKKLKERQKQAQIIIQSASDQHKLKQRSREPHFSLQPPTIVNHLLIKPTDMSKNTLKTPVHLNSDLNVLNEKLKEKINESKSLVESILHLDEQRRKSREYFSDDDSSDDQDEVIEGEKKSSLLELASRTEGDKSGGLSTSGMSAGVLLNDDKHRKLSRESSKSVNSAIMENLVKEESRNLTPVNPFPTRHLNSNVAKNGHRLGLYK
ncbi:TBC1 domain family member [Brachionus plicatilis]|uniref:TBC1 domain family member n=1 Tax=Brachionus plicatilis TaxID=10195 RepID=A0A3M7RKV1_BRAPC|nr:TBC1 domain family member [Brachionus plicatilis]